MQRGKKEWEHPPPQNNNKKNTPNRISKKYGTISRYDICVMEAQKKNEKLFEVIMTENFPKLMTNTKP